MNHKYLPSKSRVERKAARGASWQCAAHEQRDGLAQAKPLRWVIRRARFEALINGLSVLPQRITPSAQVLFTAMAATPSQCCLILNGHTVFAWRPR